MDLAPDNRGRYVSDTVKFPASLSGALAFKKAELNSAPQLELGVPKVALLAGFCGSAGPSTRSVELIDGNQEGIKQALPVSIRLRTFISFSNRHERMVASLWLMRP
jgi:hypothetical protein